MTRITALRSIVLCTASLSASLALASQISWQAGAAHAVVTKIDAAHGVVTLDAGPIASLGMPAMIMDYTLGQRAMASRLKVGQHVDFTAVMKGNDYVVDHIAPAAH